MSLHYAYHMMTGAAVTITSLSIFDIPWLEGPDGDVIPYNRRTAATYATC